MRLVTQISDDFKQAFRITTEDNITFDFSLSYNENRQQWFWGLTYNNITINGQGLVIDPSFLRRFVAYLPFGMACYATGAQVDPYLLNDFITGRIQIYTMTLAEVELLELELYKTVPVIT
ncbi:MAG: hypothetical protein ACRC6O_13185 [Flavobacterium sp.]